MSEQLIELPLVVVLGYTSLKLDHQCSTCCENNCLLYSCCGENIFYFFMAFVLLWQSYFCYHLYNQHAYRLNQPKGWFNLNLKYIYQCSVGCWTSLTLKSASGHALWRSQADIIGHTISYRPCTCMPFVIQTFSGLTLLANSNSDHIWHLFWYSPSINNREQVRHHIWVQDAEQQGA
jgi:hypothetical protein